MRGTIFAAALVATLPISTPAFDLKGFAPGMPIAQVKELYPKLDCNIAHEGKRHCYYKAPTQRLSGIYPAIEELNTFAGVPVNSWFITHADDKVTIAGVQLPSSRFDQVAGALAEKYGSPTKRERSTVKTRAGVEHEQVEWTWLAGEEILRAKRLASNIDTMSVTLTSKQAAIEAEERRREERKSGAKDL